MNIQQNISLKAYNTFGIDVFAKRFVSVDSVYNLQKILAQEKNIFLLSGGSNILLTQNINKLVVYINIKGISVDFENENEVFLTVNSGENWHEFVVWCISQNYGGLENLSLIPGRVGTSPIQNIGAYGVEVKNVITKVEAIDINTAKRVEFSNADCAFGYRNSIFKNDLKGKVVITSVSFKLSKKQHQLHTNYGAIEQQLTAKNIINPTIKDVSDAVIYIRKSKLPDPKKIGNSGSFFKNPIVSKESFKLLKLNFSDIPSYEVSDKLVKIPAGWLIEKAGLKGKRFGRYGVHKKQALVLVNYGGAEGNDIKNLAYLIQDTILKIFEIYLELEVNII